MYIDNDLQYNKEVIKMYVVPQFSKKYIFFSRKTVYFRTSKPK